MIGVIICVDGRTETATAIEMRRQLTLRFPGVEFAVVPAVHAMAFEYGDDAFERGYQAALDDPHGDDDP